MSGERAVVKPGATYQDVIDLPVGWVGEILDGTLYGHPRPASGHARTHAMLMHLLIGPFDVGDRGPGGWYFLTEPELHFGDDVLVPDISAWRKERMPEPPERHTPFLTLPPDWVCEILSPGTRSVDLRRKLPRYREVGVGFAWTIDPIGRSVETWVAEDGRWRSGGKAGGDEQATLMPFDAVPLDLSLLWR